MSIPKILVVGAVVIFSVIAVSAYFKKEPKSAAIAVQVEQKTPVITAPIPETPVVSVVKKPEQSAPIEVKVKNKKEKKQAVPVNDVSISAPAATHALKDDFPTIDRIFQLFTTGPSKLPIVETINYTSSVPWLKGRPAWVADYASYFGTSRHFIARSLNGKPDYFSQKVIEGSKFNVFRKDKRLQFYLLVDVSRLKMGFYYVDLDTNERVLLKTYSVGLGRLDSTKASGSLTPLGKYSLGDRVAIYKPGTISFFQEQQAEMIRVLGTRWIPFEEEVDRVTASAKGYGIYGAPWIEDQTGNLVENRECLGKYDTDGGIRMATEDLEELFAIVITKPAFVVISKDFREAKLPGIEVATPTR